MASAWSCTLSISSRQKISVMPPSLSPSSPGSSGRRFSSSNASGSLGLAAARGGARGREWRGGGRRGQGGGRSLMRPAV
eukprot:7693327-Pyramimonas_sp.AAC.1